MSVIYSIAALVAVLYATYLIRTRAKSDAVVSELVIQPKAEELKDAAEVAQLTQEIKDAKIDYAADAERARLEYLKSRGK